MWSVRILLFQLMLISYAACQDTIANATAGSGMIAPALPVVVPPTSAGNETSTNATRVTGVEITQPALSAAVPPPSNDTMSIAQNITSPGAQSKDNSVESAKPTSTLDAGIVAPVLPPAGILPAGETAPGSHNATAGGAAVAEPTKDSAASHDSGPQPALPAATVLSVNDTAPSHETSIPPAAGVGTGMIQPALPAAFLPASNDTVPAARSQDETGTSGPAKSADAGAVQSPLPAVASSTTNDTAASAVNGTADAPSGSGGQNATATVEPVKISAAPAELAAPALPSATSSSSNDTVPSSTVTGAQVGTVMTQPAKPAAAVSDAGLMVAPALPAVAPLPSNETVAPAGTAAITDAQVGPGMVAPALPVGIPPSANETSPTGGSSIATVETVAPVPVKTAAEGKETDTATVQGEKVSAPSPTLPAASVASEAAVKEPRALQGAGNQKDGAQFTANFKTLSEPSPQNPSVWSALDDIRGRTRLDVGAIQQILAAAVPGQDYPNLAAIPETTFSCERVNQPGFYADPDPASRCQIIRRCDANAIQWSYLCPNSTIFNQITLTCDWFFNVDCSKSANYYDYSNSRLYNAGWLFLDTPPEAQSTAK